MREPRYSILVDIQDATERAKQGKLALYWQRTIQREYRCKKVTPAEQQAKCRNGAMKKNCTMTWRTSGANSGSAISGLTTIPWCN